MLSYTQRMRLMRFVEAGGSVSELAQEIYAMMDPTIPVEHMAPITIIRPDEAEWAPFQTRGDFSEMPEVIQVRRRNGESYGTLQVGDNGLQTTDSQNRPADPPPTTGANVFPCSVVSGSGATYTVDVYTQGTASAPTRVSATVRGIDSGETIPTTAPNLFAAKVAGSWFLLAPLWM